MNIPGNSIRICHIVIVFPVLCYLLLNNENIVDNGKNVLAFVLLTLRAINRAIFKNICNNRHGNLLLIILTASTHLTCDWWHIFESYLPGLGDKIK